MTLFILLSESQKHSQRQSFVSKFSFPGVWSGQEQHSNAEGLHSLIEERISLITVSGWNISKSTKESNNAAHVLKLLGKHREIMPLR